MRNVDNEVVNLILNRDTKTVGNTTVNYRVPLEKSVVALHGHHIVDYKHSDNSLEVCFQGYVTNVTKNRINSIIEGLGLKTKFKVVKGELCKVVEGEAPIKVSSQEWLSIES